MAKELTLDVARDMYATGNEAMMEYALEFFSKEDLCPIQDNSEDTKFPTTFEQSVALFPSVMRLSFNPEEIPTDKLFSSNDFVNSLWMCSTDEDMPMKFIQLSCLLCIRNAWWKLDNNWKPLCTEFKYIITTYNDKIVSTTTTEANYILSFRTERLRNQFYSSFSKIIDNVKEFL